MMKKNLPEKLVLSGHLADLLVVGILIYWKLTGVIDWGWHWVTLPLWGGAILTAVFYGLRYRWARRVKLLQGINDRRMKV